MCQCGLRDSIAISKDKGVLGTRTFLKDIDVTMDYAGSFDREEVIDYMVTNHTNRVREQLKTQKNSFGQ